MTRRPLASSRAGRAGYVLVEALATLALSALVLAGIASLVGLMLRSADRTALSAEEIETIGRATAAVERDIGQAVRVHRVVDGTPRLVFVGQADELRLVIDRPDEAGLMEPVVVRWKSEVTASGRGRLTRSEAPLVSGLPAPDTFEAGQAVDTGPAVLRFAYFGPSPDGAGEVLTDSWTTPTALPSGIRLGRADPRTLQVSGSIRTAIRPDAEIGCIESTMGWCSLTPERQQEDQGTGQSGRDQSGRPDDGRRSRQRIEP
jgi:general secretion pathway protein J